MLVDGELDESASSVCIDQMHGDAEARARWAVYHLIGDQLRGEGALSPGFVASFTRRLEREVVVKAPRRRAFHRPNWSMLASAAAAVVLLSWAILSLQPAVTDDLRAASTVPAQPVVLPLVDGEAATREYLIAHLGVAGGNPLGAVSYVRSVAYVGAEIAKAEQ